MPIHVDVLVNLHKRSVTNATRSLKREFDQAANDIGKDVGREIGDRIAQGIRSSSPEVNKAMDDATNAAINRRRMKQRMKEVKKLWKEGEASVEDYVRAVEDLGKATRTYDQLATKLRSTEEGYQKTFRERADVTKQANAALKNFTASHDDHLNALNQLRAANLDIIHQNNQVAKAFDTAGDSINKSSREYAKFQRMEQDGKATRDQLLKQWQAVHDAWDKETRHIRDATAALQKHGAEQERHRVRQEEHLRRQRERANNSDFGEVGSWAARNLGALTPLGVVTPTLVLPLGVAFTQVANAAVAASQGVALLPGVLAAAGAGMGTLKMATSGFSDTISALTSGDMEKFATAIQRLSPNAQQAALTIQNLLPQLKGIQQATQDAFFKDTGAMIFDLTKSYGPAIQQLTTRIAGGFNGVMATVFNDLMSPGTQGKLNSMFDNIAAAFERLSPVVKPFVDAFVDLADVGSSFLPGMVEDLASMAQSFADFISQARASGDLANFMNIGWESIKAVGSALLDLGKTIYDVFGLKSAQDIADFKETMKELSDLLGITLAFLKHLFEDAGKFVREFSSALGPLGDNANALGEKLAWLAEIIIGAKFIGWVGKGIGKLAGFGGAAKTAATEVEAIDGAAAAAAKGGGLAALTDAGFLALSPFKQLAVILAGGWVGQQSIKSATDAAGGDNSPGGKQIRNGLFAPGMGVPGAVNDPAFAPDYSVQNIPGQGDTGRGGGGQALHTGQSAPTGASVGRGNLSVPQATPWLSGNWSPSPVPPQPNDAQHPFAAPPGSFELSNIPLGQFSGATWQLPGPGTYTPPGYGKGPGTYEVDPQKVQEEKWAVEKQAQNVEEARKKVLELRAATVQDQDAIQQAEHNVIEQEQNLIKERWKLADAETGTFTKLKDNTKNLKDSFDELGAGLDKDLGLSKGLPGLADNLVRFIGALAAAPLLGPLNAITNAMGGKDATSVGLSGVLAAQGAFGPRFQVAGYDENGKPYSVEAAMAAGLGQPGVQNLNSDMSLSGRMNAAPFGGPASQGVPMGALNLSNLPDAHGAKVQISYMTALANAMGLNLTSGKNDHFDDGLNHPKGLAGDFAIPGMNAPDPKKLGFAQFLHDNFGDLLNELIYSDPNFSGTLSMGKPYQYDAGTLADHQNHVHASVSDANAPEFIARMQALAANGQLPQIPGLSGSMSPSGLGGMPSGTVPVYVVNMPGGSGFGDLMSSSFGGSGNPPGMGNAGGPVNASMASNAQKVVAEGIKRGLPPDVIKAGLAIALQETALGTNPRTNAVQNQNGTPGIQGMFQQDNSYAYDKTNPALAAGGFFDRFIQNGGTKPGVDPWTFAVTGVQKPAKLGAGGYDSGAGSGAWLQGQWGQQATDFYNQFATPGPGTPGAMSNVWNQGAPVYNPILGKWMQGGREVPPPGGPAGPVGPPPLGPTNFPFPPGAVPATGPMMAPFPEWQNQATIPYVGMDTGGTLDQGPTLVVNNTGQQEHVVNPQGMVGDQHVSELFPGPGAGNNPFATFNPSNALGMGAQRDPGTDPNGQQYGGDQANNASNAGGQNPSGGGLAGLLTSAAATAADGFAPGSGAAVQIASQVAQRAIKLGGQLAGVGVQGLMETFLPTGASQLANNNWLTRIGGAFAGVGPQLPNLAGKPPTPVPDQPQQLAQFPQSLPTGPAPQAQGTTIINNLYGVGDVKDTSWNSWQNDMQRSAGAGMPSSMPQGSSGTR